jgi:two-component system, cell cycle sensor histidine kinase and response regulator CckA
MYASLERPWPSPARVLSNVRHVLVPEGRPLPETIWRRRHWGIVALLWAHVLGLAVFAILAGSEPRHALAESGVVALFAVLAGFERLGRRFASTMACLGLLTSSALLVHFSGGYIEMHFHFFVMVGLMALYQDWIPFLLAIGYVVVHHGVVGVLEPRSVFNHAAAWANPWMWAGIHGVFIVGMSIVSLISWRLNELAVAHAELILGSAGEGIVGVDEEGRTTFANDAAAALTGWRVGELAGRPLDALVLTPGQDPPWRMQPADEPSVRVELTFRRKDGATFPVECVSAPIRQRGAVVGSVVLFNDITLRTQAENARRETELRLRSTTDAAADAVIAAEEGGGIVSWNRGAEAIFGYAEAEIVGRPLGLLVPERLRETYVRSLERAGAAVRPVVARGLDFTGLRKDGTEFPLELSLGSWDSESGRFYVGIIRDVTGRKRAEETLHQTEQQLRQAQKMEVVGQLAGGIAHDFNNLLTVMLGRSHVLLSRLEPASPLRHDLELIATTAASAGALTQRLLAFSRKQMLQPKVLNLNGAVLTMASMLRRIIGEHLHLETDLEATLGAVRADPVQFEQVIVNLAVNARDAMPERGTLTIETRNVELDEAAASRHAGLAAGPHVLLAVRDTGCGMDAQVQAHLFEPFFTTKGPGKGTGLGLATVYGIVTQHDGAIAVQSAPGKGTTFRIYLPRAVGEASVARPARPAAVGGHETILLVEDDELVRDLAREVLHDGGYSVLASAPGDAVSLAERHAGRIDLLLTDVVMPDIGGRELARHVARISPTTRVLYMSGYTDDLISRHGVLDDHAPLLGKPFMPAELLHKVREVLARPATS